jgi:hypothetical protein
VLPHWVKTLYCSNAAFCQLLRRKLNGPGLQRDALQRAGCREEHVFVDIASGARTARPGLAACLQALGPGDTLVVWRLDRLGRSMTHLVTLIDELLAQNERGCHQRQCSYSTRLFKQLWEALNHPKGLCQNLSQYRSGGTLKVARLVAHASNVLK